MQDVQEVAAALEATVGAEVIADEVGATALRAELRTLADASVDAVIDTRALKAETMSFESGAKVVRLVAHTPQGELGLAINESAHQQVADKLKIPYTYYQRMQQTAPHLLAANINCWLHTEPDRHMLRMMKPITAADQDRLGTQGAAMALRAFVSPKYRALDNAPLLDVLLPLVKLYDLQVASYDLSDTRFRLKVVGANRTIAEIRAQYADLYGLTGAARQELMDRGHAMVNGRDIGWVNEVITTGFSVTNSETGHGALSVEALLEILRCLNDYRVRENRRAIHVGRGKDDGFIAADTQRLEEAAVFLRVRDAIVEVVKPETVVRLAQSVEAGVGAVLEPEQPMFEFIGNVGLQFGLTDAEQAVLSEEVAADMLTAGYPGAGRLNQFALAQGFTALAKQADPDRRADLERAGWEVLVSPTRKLLELAAKAKDN